MKFYKFLYLMRKYEKKLFRQTKVLEEISQSLKTYSELFFHLIFQQTHLSIIGKQSKAIYLEEKIFIYIYIFL